MSDNAKFVPTLAHPLSGPDTEVNARDVFGIDVDMMVPAFSAASDYVPNLDPNYQFDHDTTIAILAGFAHNRRVMVQGYHGTGKSTHIEQVAARLNWPCIRVNLDSHISRIDLIGKDAIVLRDGKQVTEFREGILPWALQNPVALVFDEYDAGRADVMFVIQRVLEVDGKLTLLDSNKVIHPNRIFAYKTERAVVNVWKIAVYLIYKFIFHDLVEDTLYHLTIIMHKIYPLIKNTNFPSIKRSWLKTIQVNLGYKCNQSCLHCHQAIPLAPPAKRAR